MPHPIMNANKPCSRTKSTGHIIPFAAIAASAAVLLPLLFLPVSADSGIKGSLDTIRNMITDILKMGSNEFQIAFAEESPEELIETILEAIDYEMDRLLSPDFIEAFPPNHINSESESNSLYSYVNNMSIALKKLSEVISSTIDMIVPDKKHIAPCNKILQTATKTQQPAASGKAGNLPHDSMEL